MELLGKKLKLKTHCVKKNFKKFGNVRAKSLKTAGQSILKPGMVINVDVKSGRIGKILESPSKSDVRPKTAQDQSLVPLHPFSYVPTTLQKVKYSHKNSHNALCFVF